jgi:hypothetical protein
MPSNYRCILFAAAAAGLQLLPAPLWADQLDDTARIIEAQLHKQGVACTMAQRAMRDAIRSVPHEAVWIVHCDEATYRVKLIPRRQAFITPIGTSDRVKEDRK